LMALVGGSTSGTDAVVALSRFGDSSDDVRTSASMLDRVHRFLSEGVPEPTKRLLDAAHARATRIARAGGQSPASETTAAQVYAADVVASLAAEGQLDPGDTSIAAGSLSEACAIPLAAASFDLFLRTVSSPVLLELPPIVSAEIQLRVLVDLGVAAEVSVWRRAADGDIECLFNLGGDSSERSVRSEAKAAVSGRGGSGLLRRSSLRSRRVYRFGGVVGAIVARIKGERREELSAYLDFAALSLGPLLEREWLLRRSAAGERALLGNAEARLTRFGFDLHDGPVQEVLVLGHETRALRDQIYPFLLESHRELAYGRFEDLLARVVELDRQLREAAHSLESRSIVSRPLAEILHREVEAFGARSSIEATLTIQGDPEILGPQQRVAVFRAIQESLSNVREHSGASVVEIRLTMRRNWVEVKVTDNGHGFEVNRSLAHAAQRGRLGIVGMGERMRMLGGTFDIDSEPGGPTTLRFALPRWEPFERARGGQH
jgi:signal transduction histidine kinase